MADRREVSKGSKTDLQASAYTIAVSGGPIGTVDLMAVLLDSGGRVRSDDDLVFFNNRTAPGVALVSDNIISVSLPDVPADVHRVLIAASTEAQGKRFDEVPALQVDINGGGDRTTFHPHSLATETVLQLVAVYRRGGQWRLDAIGQGYAGGLASFATDFGVSVDDPGAESKSSDHPPPSPTPTAQPRINAQRPTVEIRSVLGNEVTERRQASSNDDGGGDARSTKATPAPSEGRSEAGRLGGRRRVLIGGSVIGAVLLIVVIGLTGRTDSTTTAPPTTANTATPAFPTPIATPPVHEATPAPLAPIDTADTLAKLATLAIKGRAPKTGYDRALFGPAWSDDTTADGGHNGCNTRSDILRRDLVDVQSQPDANGCIVIGGVLHDPYTGTTVEYRRGTPSISVDHVVALADAWQKGAQQWDAAQRAAFANDPINLQATTRSINAQKGDGDAATWLPPNKSYRCTYISRIVNVKAAYGLWVTQAEHDAIAQILTSCGATPAPPAPPTVPVTPPHTPDPTAHVPSPSLSPPTPTPTPTPSAPTVAPPDGSSVYYPSCKAARAAGAAPLHRGEPGYRPGLDRDGDGVACE